MNKDKSKKLNSIKQHDIYFDKILSVSH